MRLFLEGEETYKGFRLVRKGFRMWKATAKFKMMGDTRYIGTKPQVKSYIDNLEQSFRRSGMVMENYVLAE